MTHLDSRRSSAPGRCCRTSGRPPQNARSRRDAADGPRARQGARECATSSSSAARDRAARDRRGAAADRHESLAARSRRSSTPGSRATRWRSRRCSPSSASSGSRSTRALREGGEQTDAAPALRALVRNHAAAVDVPACMFYNQLAQEFPRAKVVLTVHPRGAAGWYASTMATLFPLQLDVLARTWLGGVQPRAALHRLAMGLYFDGFLTRPVARARDGDAALPRVERARREARARRAPAVAREVGGLARVPRQARAEAAVPAPQHHALLRARLACASCAASKTAARVREAAADESPGSAAAIGGRPWPGTRRLLLKSE